MKTFQARIRRQGETNPRRVRIGSFPTISVTDARRKLVEMKSLAREGQDPTLEQRRARSGVVKIRTLWDLINERLGRLEGGDVAPKNQRLSPTLTNFFKLSLVRCLVILAGSS
jgi:Arm DNA-binding domain